MRFFWIGKHMDEMVKNGELKQCELRNLLLDPILLRQKHVCPNLILVHFQWESYHFSITLPYLSTTYSSWSLKSPCWNTKQCWLWWLTCFCSCQATRRPPILLEKGVVRVSFLYDLSRVKKAHYDRASCANSIW